MRLGFTQRREDAKAFGVRLSDLACHSFSRKDAKPYGFLLFTFLIDRANLYPLIAGDDYQPILAESFYLDGLFFLNKIKLLGFVAESMEVRNIVLARYDKQSVGQNPHGSQITDLLLGD